MESTRETPMYRRSRLGLAGFPETLTVRLTAGTYRGAPEISAAHDSTKLVINKRLTHACRDGETWVLRPTKRIADTIVVCDPEYRLFDANGKHEITLVTRRNAERGDLIAVWASLSGYLVSQKDWAATATLVGVKNDRDTISIVYKEPNWRWGDRGVTFYSKTTLRMPIGMVGMRSDDHGFNTLVWRADPSAAPGTMNVQVKFLDEVDDGRDMADNVLFSPP